VDRRFEGLRPSSTLAAFRFVSFCNVAYLQGIDRETVVCGWADARGPELLCSERRSARAFRRRRWTGKKPLLLLSSSFTNTHSITNNNNNDAAPRRRGLRRAPGVALGARAAGRRKRSSLCLFFPFRRCFSRPADDHGCEDDRARGQGALHARGLRRGRAGCVGASSSYFLLRRLRRAPELDTRRSPPTHPKKRPPKQHHRPSTASRWASPSTTTPPWQSS
jgi:hypothetical protein